MVDLWFFAARRCTRSRAFDQGPRGPIANLSVALANGHALPAIPVVARTDTVHRRSAIAETATDAKIEALRQQHLGVLAASVPRGKWGS